MDRSSRSTARRLPDQLVESELFGFERGAFTGAQQSKPGQIELARGGVLFLDEIAEMTPSAQAKLLRVLQEREFQRLGGTGSSGPTSAWSPRPIAISARRCSARVPRGSRYRVNVFDIRLPPLRDRGDDVMLLAESFLEDIARARQGRRFMLTPLAAGALRGV